MSTITTTSAGVRLAARVVLACTCIGLAYAGLRAGPLFAGPLLFTSAVAGLAAIRGGR